jgi:hypothetical protein
LTPDKILDFALPAATAQAETILQFGGKASVGRGRCRLLPIPDGRPAGPLSDEQEEQAQEAISTVASETGSPE